MGRVGPIVLVVALAMLLGRLPTGRLPQVVKGDDALSVAFGDARTALAQMMVQKSDSYFHGGIDMDCPCKGCKEGHCEDHHHGQGEDAHAKGSDPWGWINRHVRAPQRHIHLDGERTAELIPFYWAALRANPHDVETWTTAIFVASDNLADDRLTLRLIAEAKEKNPTSAEIAFAEGRYLRKKGERSAARKSLEQAARLLDQKGVANWTEDDRILSSLITAFLNSVQTSEIKRPLPPSNVLDSAKQSSGLQN